MKFYNGQCLECGGPFFKFIIDKQFCTDVCRMRSNRRIQKLKLDRLEELIEKLPWQKSLTPDLFS